MLKFTSALALVGSLASVQALSTSCTGQLAGLALGNLGQCLQITSLLPVVSATGSLTDSVNTYLNSFCASSTPTCSNDTLTSANSSITSGCSSDLQSGGTDAAEVKALQSLLDFYPQFKTAACSKNSTLNQFCVTSTLTQAQNITGTTLDASFLSSLLGGSGNATSALTQALGTGQLCTGCVQTIYNQAVSANASIASSAVGSAISSACPNFASQSASGVSTAASSAAATSGGASSSAAASSSKSAGTLTVSSFSNGVVMSAIAVIGAVAVGGALVL